MLSRKYKHLNKGFTLVELMISVTILTGIVAIVGQYLYSSFSTHSMAQLQSYMKSNSERGLNRITRHISQSRRLFGQGAVGTAYLAKLDLTQAPPPIGGVQLPLIRTIGSMAKEKNCEVSPSDYFLPNSVGNTLLFAELDRTFQIVKDGATFTYSHEIDLYRMIYVYVTDSIDPDTGDAQTFLQREPVELTFIKGGDKKYAQNLIQWRSVLIADHRQLQDFYNFLDSEGVSGEKAAVANSLNAAGVTVAWRRDQDVPNSAFYTVAGGGTLPIKAGGFKIPQFQFEDALRLQNVGSNTYSIAYNTNTDTSQAGFFPTKTLHVPHYYNPTLESGLVCPQVLPVPTASPASGKPSWAFPRGFEVIIAGPQSGRSVLIHLSLVGKGYNPNMVAQKHSVTTYARDL